MVLAALKVFTEKPETRRLALLFAWVYFAQGMWALPDLSLTFLLKEKFSFSPADVATFFTIATIPWYIKPLYGLLSDFLPIWGYRRKSYFILATLAAVAAGLSLGGSAMTSYQLTLALFTCMALGFAFADVLADALMVENGQALGITGSLQAVQWGSIMFALVVVGVSGGYLAQHTPLNIAFRLTAIFPAVTFLLVFWAVRETRRGSDPEVFRRTWRLVRSGIVSRRLWVIAGFIFFYNFSPSFGPSIVYYMTDHLKFDKLFIGALDSVSGASGIVGAALYFVYSKSFPFRTIINWSIGSGVVGTLAYFGLVGHASAVTISLVFGSVSLIAQLAFLDLAARGCPKEAEGTFFALLMSIFNLGTKGSQIVGGWLYTTVGYQWLVVISAAFTAAAWLLVPLVKIDELEPRAEPKGAISPAPAAT
jgi:MFS family permease